ELGRTMPLTCYRVDVGQLMSPERSIVIVVVEYGGCETRHGKQTALGAGIGGQRDMVIEMVPGDVGQSSNIDRDGIQPTLNQRMRTGLEKDDLGASLAKFGQLTLYGHSVGRSVSG